MDFGITSKMNEYYFSGLYQNKVAGMDGGNEFLSAVSAKAAENVGAHIPYYKMDHATFLEYMERTMASGGSSELSNISRITKAYCTGKPGVCRFFTGKSDIQR